MSSRTLDGALAGAVGTLALDATTYLDIALRGRAPSEVPAQSAGRAAAALRLPLGDEPRAGHRRTGLGALLGYAAGIGSGAGYGIVRARHRGAPLALAGLALGAAAMAGANAPAVAAGLTDPRRWGRAGWLADIVPHLVFGFATAAAFERLAGRSAKPPVGGHSTGHAHARRSAPIRMLAGSRCPLATATVT
ncbi:MAG TPA: hypothetical protein VFZ77_22285 [Acidimicrobiales bacterium]